MATYDRYINSDPAIGSDSADGSIGSPWLTTYPANHLTVGSDFYHFYFTDNGWTYPYRAANDGLGGAYDAATIIPGYGATTATDDFEWNCNNAVITGTARLTGMTWTRLPGSSYVYYCSPGWTATPSVLLGVGTGVTWFGEEAIWLQKLTDIPSSIMDHCWYWDSVADILYFCDHSGNPDDTGVLFEYGNTNTAIYASAKGNHKIIGGRIFPGIQRCMYFNGPYNTFLRNKFFYGGVNALVSLEGSTWKDNLFAYNLLYGAYQLYTSNALLTLYSNGVTGLPNKFYNNTFYSGCRAIWLNAGTGSVEPHIIKNNLFVDQYIAVFLVGSGALMVEDYNLYGVSKNEIASVSLGITSGLNSIPSAATSSTTDVKIIYPERSVAPAVNSPARNAGEVYSSLHDSSCTDLMGRRLVEAPDIGAIEYRRSCKMYFYIELFS